ncbi:MAG: dynein regulation protein LC7 [Aquificae bacterium]|nr:dynein regulation protein LC7 [Aquificota bacterium]
MTARILQKQAEVREKFKSVVRENNLDGIFLSDMEGLPIVSYFNEEVDEDTVAASSAAIVSAGLITTSDAKKRNMNQIIIDTDDGYMVFIPIKDEFILGIITPPDTKLGILRLIAEDLEAFIERL